MYLEFRERSSNWEDMHASHKVHEGICDRRTSRFLGSWCVCAQEGEGEEESADCLIFSTFSIVYI